MKNTILLSVALASASCGVHAQDLGYTYLEGGYARVNVDIDGVGDADFDGVQLRGSAQIGVSDFYVFGGLGIARNDDAGVDVDFSELQGGVGYRYEIGSSVDLISELSVLRQMIDADGVAGADASGGRIAVGARVAMADNVEGYAKLGYTGGGDFDGSFNATIGAQYRWSDSWGVVGELERSRIDAGVDVIRLLIGVRATF